MHKQDGEQGQGGASDAQKREEDRMLRAALVKVLEPAAYERLMIVKSQNPQLYANSVRWIIAMVQQGRIESVDEKTLRSVLLKLSQGSRREPRIEIKHKRE